MRVWLSGGSGFVGRHLEFDEVLAPSHREVDVTDAAAVRCSIREYAPDVIVHAAILNDFARLEREGWAAYVGATRNIVDAARDALVILVSTDWVFDGTQGPASEDEPPNPINLYGMLKAASELVVLARGGAVARISAVQGSHGAPRSQDAGFGYFVAAIVRTLRAGERFTVWEGPSINGVATPTLAPDAGELIRRIGEGGHTGVFHCCGGESVDRRTLALRTVEAFGLDAELLDFGPPPAQPWPVPYDTRLDATATAATLGVELPDLDTQLQRLERSMACTT
ncbi:MAG TPA: sugar nucleotide-binding protein [Solirubrobacteraceae bacterium]|nr:sugar nucleotide-binding protein [Solirubrobacteraceae bacterium]